jgi:hypothetical protein
VQSLLVLLEGADAICRQSNHIDASSCVFKMFKNIEKPVACEIRSVIRFLNARNMKPADIHRQLCEVYGEHAMSDSMVRSHRWRDMGVARNPWLKAAYVIAKQENIQTDHFNSQDHVHSVLGQKRRSACGIIASRLNNQRRCLLRHT